MLRNLFNVGGNAAADGIAKWDGENWSSLGNIPIGCPQTTGTCLIAVAIGKNDAVYVGGQRENLFDIDEADFVAKWNGTEWSALGSNGDGDGAFSDPVLAMAVDQTGPEDIVYLSMVGTTLRNNDDSVGHLIKWDGTEWSQAGPNKIAEDYPLALTVTSNGGVLIGGEFYEGLAAFLPILMAQKLMHLVWIQALSQFSTTLFTLSLLMLMVIFTLADCLLTQIWILMLMALQFLLQLI